MLRATAAALWLGNVAISGNTDKSEVEDGRALATAARLLKAALLP